MWNRRLKVSGFADIEDDYQRLKEFHSFRKVNLTNEEIEATRQYYSLCEQLLLTYDFKSALEKQIWSLHCVGLTLPEICRRTATTIHKKRVKGLIERLDALVRNE